MSLALVVDDSMLIRHTVCRYLEERGWSVESVTDGAEAVQALQQLRPDLIVTDMMMPRMTGSELITALKKNPETAQIPIIILCGRNSEREAKANEKRADYAIYKDIDILKQLDQAMAVALAGATPAAGN
jgi:CheY-like chemotaxis protein